ncbi:MAG: hypothetical protein HQ517_14675 [SAR324 cluster bacterium]|nr:hypothetical protein [SAR324 cluster bacterium]
MKHKKEINIEEIVVEIERLRKDPVKPNPFNTKYRRLLSLDYKAQWKERDNFINWITVLSTGTTVFSINTIMMLYKEVPVPQTLKWSLFFLLLSIMASILFKIHWGVKYAPEKLDLTVLGHLWESKEIEIKALEREKQGGKVEKTLIDELEQSIRESYELLNDNKSSLLEKLKREIDKKILYVTYLYRISLFSFLLGFILLVLFVFGRISGGL